MSRFIVVLKQNLHNLEAPARRMLTRGFLLSLAMLLLAALLNPSGAPDMTSYIDRLAAARYSVELFFAVNLICLSGALVCDSCAKKSRT